VSWARSPAGTGASVVSGVSGWSAAEKGLGPLSGDETIAHRWSLARDQPLDGAIESRTERAVRIGMAPGH
jgi:hypothetical protein